MSGPDVLIGRALIRLGVRLEALGLVLIRLGIRLRNATDWRER
jgi:hypothetical protein